MREAVSNRRRQAEPATDRRAAYRTQYQGTFGITVNQLLFDGFTTKNNVASAKHDPAFSHDAAPIIEGHDPPGVLLYSAC